MNYDGNITHEIIKKINYMKALIYLPVSLPIEITNLYEMKIEAWEIEIELIKQFQGIK